MKLGFKRRVSFIILLWFLLALSYFLIDFTSHLPILRTNFTKFNNYHGEMDDLMGWGVENVGMYVRTTDKNYKSRLLQIINTYFTIIPQNVFFVTDTDHNFHSAQISNLITTNCNPTHQKEGLCCKLQTALLLFLNTNKKWMCHSDDDTYLYLSHLFWLLRRHDHKNDHYIGKKSVEEPLMSEGRPYEFATGGGGYCLSRSLVLKLYPYVRNGGLEQTCERLKLPDDCVLGYLITSSLGVMMTSEEAFHSHLEGLSLQYFIHNSHWISFSYLPEVNDPQANSWMYSIHCNLYPGHNFCKILNQIHH